MDKTEAQKLLGVHSDGEAGAVQAAYQKKQAHVNTLLEKAPTEALKAKYQQKLAELKQAHAVLSQGSGSASSDNAEARAGFSQSKFEDLPFVKPRHSQFEDQAKAELSIQEGQVLAGRYKIEEKIAAGGMGVVYRAHDQNRDEDIAIKVMLPSLVKNARAKERFLEEARLSSKLSHPNIVNVYDVQNDGDFYFLTMELLEGQDLRDVMENRKTTRQPFTKDEVLDLLDQITAGLNHAHQSTVHRDLKPENIYLTEDGEYKVMDFGIARVQSTSQRTQSGSVSGTAYYMAPEQVKGAKDIDARADQYAIAVFTYELLAGEVPTGMITPLNELRPDVGKGFSRALERALANKPEDRYDSLDNFLQALRKGKGGKARSAGSGVGSSFDSSKLAMAGVVLVGLLVMVGIFKSGLVDVDGLFVSKEEIAQRKAASAQLAGEIKNLQKRLENGRRNLDSDVRDAERNDDSNLASLEYWQRVTEDFIFERNTLTELEGQLAMADTLLRDESFDQAQQTYTDVKEGYQTLYSEFQTGEKLAELAEQTLAAERKWAKTKSNYGVSSSELEQQAKSSMRDAKGYEREGALGQALEAWQAALNAWGETQASVKSSIDQANAEAEKRRKAEKLRQMKAKVAEGFVFIPAGRFEMGSNDGNSAVKPVHTVSVQAFGMSVTEVTWNQYQKCINAGVCSSDGDEGWGKGDRPVINVSWNDAQTYIRWLNGQTGKRFRLPSEAEWEYAARARSTTKYYWGNSPSGRHANGGEDSGWPSDGYSKTAPVGNYTPNAFGLYDMSGNVWEWVQDCWNASYRGAPSDGISWESGNCGKHVLRGGSWYGKPANLRSAGRLRFTAPARSFFFGFRLAQDL